MAADLDSKRKKYPLRVYYPQGGKHELLVVFTDWDRQQFLLARGEAGLKTLLDAKIRKENFRAEGVEVRGVWHCDIVAPPQNVVDTFAEQKFRSELASFRSSLRFVIDDYAKAKPLPSMISTCQAYKPNPVFFVDDEDADGNPTSWRPPDEHEVKYHSYCLNCDGEMYNFVGCDVEDLFLKHADTLENHLRPPLRKLKPEKPKQRPVLSVAPPADPNRSLYVAWPRHGDHSSGNVVELVDEEMLKFLPFLQEYNSPLFFFHGDFVEGEPDWSKKLRKGYTERARAGQKSAKAKHHEIEKKKREAKFELLETILGIRP